MRIQSVRKLIIPAFLASISVVACGDSTQRDWSRCVPNDPKTACKANFQCINTHCVPIPDGGQDSGRAEVGVGTDSLLLTDLGGPVSSDAADAPISSERPLGDGTAPEPDVPVTPISDGAVDQPVQPGDGLAPTADAPRRDTAPPDIIEVDGAGTCGTNDKECPATAPYCIKNRCVKCSTDNDCAGRGGPACDTSTGLCVACTTDDYCKAPVSKADGGADASTDASADGGSDAGRDSGTDAGTAPVLKQYCDLQIKQCVACTKHEQCTGATAPICSPTSRTCVACNQTGTDLCSQRDPSNPSCRASDGRCVQCTNDSHGLCNGSTAVCATDCGDAAAPACVAAINTCVQCTADTHCTTAHPACDTSNNSCVGCTADKYCPSQRPACDTTAKACVQCVTDSNCGSTTPACDSPNRTCVQCTADKHCGGDKPACDSPNQTCVECTASNKSHCSGNTPVCDASASKCVQCLADSDCGGTTPMCNTSNHTCVACTTQNRCAAKSSATPQCGSSGACVECTSSSHCSGTTTPICETSTSLCRRCGADSECAGKLGADPGVCMAHTDGHCATDGETIYVQNNGSCSATGGTASQPYCSPQTAVDNLNGKKLIVLRGGSLASMAVSGTGTGTLTVVGQNDATLSGGSTNAGLSISGGELYVRRITVRYGSNVAHPGISATGGTLHLRDVVVSNNDGGGILIDGANYDIVNCLVSNNGDLYSASSVYWSGLLITPPASGASTLSSLSVKTNAGPGIACGAAIHGSGVYLSGNHPDAMSPTCTAGGNIAPCTAESASCGYNAPTP